MEYLPSYTYQLYADIQPSYTDSFMHHGIKGMHWGVRRYQNPDGSLTKAGQKRYNKLANKGDKLREKGLTGNEFLTLTKKQKIGFGLTAPVTFPVAGAVDIQQKKAIQASKSREDYNNLKKKEKEYRSAQRKEHRKRKELRKQQQNEFESVFGKNKKFNYSSIYKEMNADMNNEDSDYYKKVYYDWRKKHGFTN